MVTGKPDNRIIRAYNNARFYKSDMSGKCDSIHSNQRTALTQLIGRPVIWSGKHQMTGDVIHLIGNNRTQKIDSLKVLNNAFIISKESKLLYAGGVTNSATATKANKFYLKDALTDLMEGREIKVKESSTLGCAITRRKS